MPGKVHRVLPTFHEFNFQCCSKICTINLQRNWSKMDLVRANAGYHGPPFNEHGKVSRLPHIVLNMH